MKGLLGKFGETSKQSIFSPRVVKNKFALVSFKLKHKQNLPKKSKVEDKIVG